MPLLIHLIMYQNQLSLSDGVFNGWFGILLQDTLYFTHIRSLHPSDILTVYGLYILTPFYPTILSFTQIRSLALHILPSCVMKHISHTFFFRIVPPAIPSYLTHQCISNCFTLQPLPAQDQWDCAYQADPDTKVSIYRSINTSLDEPTIFKLSVAYRTVIVRNLLGILEGRFVYYEPIPTITNYICRIILPTSLRHTIFNLIHTPPVAGHMGEYKTLYRIRL